MSSDSSNIDDNKNWQKLLCGDLEALAFFYEKYADLLLNYGLTFTNNREVVQDSVQELFINIWNRRNNLSVPDSAKFYLMASLRRFILKDVRRARQFTDTLSDDSLHMALNDNLFADENQDHIHNKLQQAVKALPSRQQEIIFLRFFQKLSYEEISFMTGLDYQVLRNTIHRAIKSLRISLVTRTSLITPLIILLSYI